MRIIKQKAIVKVVQPQVIEYICDKCGDVCGTKYNNKKVVFTLGTEKHYCKGKCYD